jgi:hypothetical protein
MATVLLMLPLRPEWAGGMVHGRVFRDYDDGWLDLIVTRYVD